MFNLERGLLNIVHGDEVSGPPVKSDWCPYREWEKCGRGCHMTQRQTGVVNQQLKSANESQEPTELWKLILPLNFGEHGPDDNFIFQPVVFRAVRINLFLLFQITHFVVLY